MYTFPSYSHKYCIYIIFNSTVAQFQILPFFTEDSDYCPLLQEISGGDVKNCTGVPASSTTPSLAGLGSLVSSALDRRLSSGTTGGSIRSSGCLRGGGTYKLGSPGVATVAMVCSMYHTATTTLSQLRMDILTG